MRSGFGKSTVALAIAATMGLSLAYKPGAAQADPYIAEIKLFAGNFAPHGWALCNGQLLSISSNSALFAIIGTTYGGDGMTTFALPDLRGRVAVHVGAGPGLDPVSLGQQGGNNSVTLAVNQMPAHNHTATGTVLASSNSPDTTNPSNALHAKTRGKAYVNADAVPDVYMKSDNVDVTVHSTGGGAPVSVMQPYLGITYLIALNGIFPSS